MAVKLNLSPADILGWDAELFLQFRAWWNGLHRGLEIRREQ